MLEDQGMGGYITECDFDQAEAAFPGIVELYRTLQPAPPTFLDLLRSYLLLEQQPSLPHGA